MLPDMEWRLRINYEILSVPLNETVMLAQEAERMRYHRFGYPSIMALRN
jgi:hypothetical protein